MPAIRRIFNSPGGDMSKYRSAALAAFALLLVALAVAACAPAAATPAPAATTAPSGTTKLPAAVGKFTYWGGLIFSDDANNAQVERIKQWGKDRGVDVDVVMINQNETVQ